VAKAYNACEGGKKEGDGEREVAQHRGGFDISAKAGHGGEEPATTLHSSTRQHHDSEHHQRSTLHVKGHVAAHPATFRGEQ
jgi:hypothetical protein